MQTLQNLTAANNAKRAAHPNDINTLKKHLVKDLFNAYEDFKEKHIVKTKTPGLAVYESITTQVSTKFDKCFFIEANGSTLVEDAYDTFLKSFTVSIENRARRLPNVSSVRINAALAKGQVGVQSERYNPPMTQNMIEGQSSAKEELKTMMLTVRESLWNLNEISKLMHWTYDLQRRDIASALEKIKNNSNDQDEIETGRAGNFDKFKYIYYLKLFLPFFFKLYIYLDSELLRLQSEWPFLFQLRWQADHFLKLTGFVVELAVNDYVNTHLETLIMFLCSTGTEAAIKNIAIRHLWERNGRDRDLNLLIAIMMIANYFNEDYHVFIKTAEVQSLILYTL